MCQINGCSNDAIWAIQAVGETGSLLVCKKHYAVTAKTFEKLGYTLKATILT